MKGKYLIQFVYMDGQGTASEYDFATREERDLAWEQMKARLTSDQILLSNNGAINMRNVMYINLIDND